MWPADWPHSTMWCQPFPDTPALRTYPSWTQEQVMRLQLLTWWLGLLYSDLFCIQSVIQTKRERPGHDGRTRNRCPGLCPVWLGTGALPFLISQRSLSPLLLRNLLISASIRNRLDCTQCLQHPWLMKDTKTMEAKKLSKDRMKKYMARRKWQVMRCSLWTGILLLLFAFQAILIPNLTQPHSKNV